MKMSMTKDLFKHIEEEYGTDIAFHLVILDAGLRPAWLYDGHLSKKGYNRVKSLLDKNFPNLMMIKTIPFRNNILPPLIFNTKYKKDALNVKTNTDLGKILGYSCPNDKNYKKTSNYTYSYDLSLHRRNAVYMNRDGIPYDGPILDVDDRMQLFTWRCVNYKAVDLHKLRKIAFDLQKAVDNMEIYCEILATFSTSRDDLHGLGWLSPESIYKNH